MLLIVGKLLFKNSAPFFNYILKINNQLIEDAQDLDTVMPMYNLLYYSKNFRKTSGIIIQIFQTLDIWVTMEGQEYFIQLIIQKFLIVKQNWLVHLMLVIIIPN